ncbi:uncharacterized protein PODANS_4_2280 [Podospora anserina S mat+]|uniref:Ankyrin n=1 Tax=Podospora anserina (strain S / ATCC MYA-4624 / DSM 980 / FGSC 10383) TaxID=515849 RepID=B2ADW5_PODAN|nr:uncharacterized protein PODANS_4_2280 [Podospora anserina S mat+]CAP61630.1 unnamed protein product [Podospora anserina S mat+]CDP27984.1 Putative Ankyrin [Podospora anserina S mat+]
MCSYALRAWVHHLAQVSSLRTRQSVLKRVVGREIGNTLTGGYWAYSNPVTRSVQPPKALLTLFASHRMIDVLEPSDQNGAVPALLEGAHEGHRHVVRDILHTFDLSSDVLINTLSAAEASGNETLLIEIVDHILARYSTDCGSLWPADVMRRASCLGLDRFLDKMLTLGCPVETEAQVMTEPRPISLLYQAVWNSQKKAARVPLQHGANINYNTIQDNTAMHLAARNGDADMIKMLIETAKPNLEGTSNEGSTPLYQACTWGHHKVAELLPHAGADPNMGHQKGEWSPLASATYEGHQRCVELLLQNGADPNSSSPKGSALFCAAAWSHTNLCQILLEAGAKPNNPDDETPIIINIACSSTNKTTLLDTMRLLVGKGTNVDSQISSSGMTALMCAAYNTSGPQAEIVNTLLSRNANVQYIDKNGDPALYHFVTVKGSNPRALELPL